MISVIDENNIEEVINFSWEACEELINISYPLRASKLELEKSLRQSLEHTDDKVLAYYKEENLVGVIQISVEVRESYLQVRTYIVEEFEEVISEVIKYLKEYYPTFKAHFGYPKENVKAINYFVSRQYECIEESSDLRLEIDDFKIGAHKIVHIERLKKEQFSSYAHFHDSHGGDQMYWNSARLYNAFDSWYVYTCSEGPEVVGSILISKVVRDKIEIFGLFIEDLLNKHEIIEKLLYHSIKDILEIEKNIKQIIFFVESKEVVQYEVARQVGFKVKGSYCCYAINL